MKFNFNPSPNLRQKQSTHNIMFDLLIGLLVIYGFSLFYYYSEHGTSYLMQAIVLMVTSIVVAGVTEVLWAVVTKQNVKKFMLSSFGWITAIILTLMCPISITPYALGVSTSLAILVGKLLFGGFGQNIFNPAAVGRAIIFASFAGAMTDITTGATPTTIMATQYNWLTIDSSMLSSLMNQVGGLGTLFNGWYPGALGETSTLLIILVGVALAFRKVIDWRVPLVYMGSIFIFASGIAIFSGMSDWLWYPLFHICSGGVAFGAVFMLTDPVTSPTSAQGRCIFALGAGIITVLIRVLANLPEGCLYSILIMNMVTPMIEKALDGKQLALRKKAWTIFGIVSVLGMGSMFLANMAIEPSVPKKPEVKPVVMLKFSDEYVNTLAAKIESSVIQADGSITYTVSAEGFAAKEGPNMPDYGHPFEPNVFEIIIEADGKTVRSLTATVVSDSEYFGDKLENKKYTEQFIGKDLSTDFDVAVNDAISGATYSAKSSVRALLEVKKALGF